MKNLLTTKDYHIFDISNLFFRKIKIGNYGICQINDKNYSLLKSIEGNIYLLTGGNVIFHIKNIKKYSVTIQNDNYTVVFCNIISKEEFLNDITEDEIFTKYITDNDIPTLNTINTNSSKTMKILDKKNRRYIDNLKFNNENIIYSINSVAGSGKTTTLLNIAKNNKNLKILYIAFNKNIIEEIKGKKEKNSISNLYPQTFDSLLRKIYIDTHGFEPNITDLKPSNISDFNDFFNGKSRAIKKYYIRYYQKFCCQKEFTCIKKYCQWEFKKDKPLLVKLWNKTLSGELLTFDSLRKLSHMNNYCKDKIDSMYSLVLIDEAQDFDPIMLDILLTTTKIPKVFVGDVRQSIYQWKGTINAFDNLPKDSININFYSTFRIGQHACDNIEKLTNVKMISRSENDTQFSSKEELDNETSWTYLFRSWKGLLIKSSEEENIWVSNFESKISYYKNLQKLLLEGVKIDEMENDNDDIPNFLLSLTPEDLDSLFEKIQNNMVNYDEAKYKMYTIHSFKGLEDDNVRIYNDICNKEANLFYVALTRGKQKIVLDNNTPNIETYNIDVNTSDGINNFEYSDKAPLKEKLEFYRGEKADENNCKRYRIFSNNALSQLLENLPKNVIDLEKIKGFGPITIKNYGQDIINIIQNHLQDTNKLTTCTLLDDNTLDDNTLDNQVTDQNKKQCIKKVTRYITKCNHKIIIEENKNTSVNQQLKIRLAGPNVNNDNLVEIFTSDTLNEAFDIVTKFLNIKKEDMIIKSEETKYNEMNSKNKTSISKKIIRKFLKKYKLNDEIINNASLDIFNHINMTT